MHGLKVEKDNKVVEGRVAIMGSTHVKRGNREEEL